MCFDVGAHTFQEAESILAGGKFIELLIPGAACGAGGHPAAQGIDTQGEEDDGGRKVEQIPQPTRQIPHRAVHGAGHVAVDIRHLSHRHSAGGGRFGSSHVLDSAAIGLRVFPLQGDGGCGGLAVFHALRIKIGEGEGGNAANLCRGAQQLAEHHAECLPIRADYGFTCSGHQFPIGRIIRFGAIELFQVAGAFHGDFHFHRFVHGQCFGIGSSGNGILTHHVGKIGRGTGGQRQGADGEDGQLCFRPHEGEEPLPLFQNHFAGHIRVALAEGSEGAAEINCAPGLPLGIGCGGTHGLVVYHGQHALHGRLKGAHLHVYGAQLRGAHRVYPAG